MNKTWLAIHREASLAAEHLAAGATLLGKANYAQQAYYYQAFFSLSVGFERSAKLALAVDYRLSNGTFPTESQLRGYCHRLDKLLSDIDVLSQRRGITGEWARLPETPIHKAIVSVLSDFSSNVTRYYNLDLITGSARIAPIDPLQAWHERVFIPTSELHFTAKQRSRVEANAAVVAALMGDYSRVLHHDEIGNVLTDIEAASAMTGMTKSIQPHVRVYVLQLASSLRSGRHVGAGSCSDVNEMRRHPVLI
jgi:hypothetical protein